MAEIWCETARSQNEKMVAGLAHKYMGSYRRPITAVCGLVRNAIYIIINMLRADNCQSHAAWGVDQLILRMYVEINVWCRRLLLQQ
jgi:nicotinamide riboside transporter PnuC